MNKGRRLALQIKGEEACASSGGSVPRPSLGALCHALLAWDTVAVEGRML